MARNHPQQHSSVLPLMTWPSQGGKKEPPTRPPQPKTPDRQDESFHSRAEPSLMTSGQWVQRASQLRDEADDVIFSRSPSRQQWQERRTIRLLEEHWYAVTTALKKLSSEVMVLQSQVANRVKADGMAVNSVNTLGLQQANFVQDLRARIGRCDSSIAVLSSDIRSLAKDMSAANRQLALLSTDVEKGSKDIDQKVQRLETNLIEQTRQEKQSKGTRETKLEESLTIVEFKTKSQLRELQESIQAIQTEYQTRQKKLQHDLAQTLEQLTGRQQQNQTQFESGVTERLDLLQRSVSGISSEQEQLSARLQSQDREMRSLIYRQMKDLEERLLVVIRGEVKGVNSNLWTGLGTMQSNVETMRLVLEGKQRLSEEALKKDIARMKKLVVVT